MRFFCQNGSNIGPNRSGMLPDHPQTLVGHFCKKTFVRRQTAKIMETPTGRKTVFSWKIITIKKDVHRYDSNLNAPMTSPSFTWSPFVKKRF